MTALSMQRGNSKITPRVLSGLAFPVPPWAPSLNPALHLLPPETRQFPEASETFLEACQSQMWDIHMQEPSAHTPRSSLAVSEDSGALPLGDGALRLPGNPKEDAPMLPPDLIISGPSWIEEGSQPPPSLSLQTPLPLSSDLPLRTATGDHKREKPTAQGCGPDTFRGRYRKLSRSLWVWSDCRNWLV